MVKRIVAILLCACAILPLVTQASFAKDGIRTATQTSVEAEITDVYDGRDGIITMTFDDGYYKTALLVQELFEQYDLYGSLMMTVSSSNSQLSAYARPDAWNALFDKGRLEPQNHSEFHHNLSENGDDIYKKEKYYYSEMVGSKITLEGHFPEYDMLSYAIPYGSMIDEAWEYAVPHYYAIRSTSDGVNSLDPPSTREKGGWYWMYSPAVMNSHFRQYPEQQWDHIKKCIDDAKDGWYLPIIHAVGNVTNADLTLEMAHKMFSYISELNKAEKVWVTTYTNAIKYVRERQNSTLNAWKEGEDIYVSVTMNEFTDDGKPLSPDVFNHPLTVKVAVPDNYGTVYYTTGGVEYSATSYSEGAKNYVNLHVIPEGSPVKIRLGNSHTYGEWEKHDEITHKRSCIECGTEDYENHSWDKGTVTKEATCKDEGTKICTCTDCGQVSEQTINPNDNHTFTGMIANFIYKGEKANCLHGDLYYYSCILCGASSKDTFEVGEKIEHKFGKWKMIKPATDDEDGIKERICSYGCGEVEREIIPKTGEDKKPVPLPLIIGISAGGVVVVGGVGAGVIIGISIKKKKKNK